MFEGLPKNSEGTLSHLGALGDNIRENFLMQFLKIIPGNGWINVMAYMPVDIVPKKTVDRVTGDGS